MTHAAVASVKQQQQQQQQQQRIRVADVEPSSRVGIEWRVTFAYTK
jgi:hypothetical protein